jgi:hypothetical protein
MIHMENLTMRTLFLALLLVPSIGTFAQQATSSAPAAGSNWQHVQALPIGASLQIKARKGRANCELKSVDTESLTCTNGKDIVFQQSDILTIKIPHRGRSTLIGLAAGAGTGAIIGAATGSPGCTQGQAFCLNIIDRTALVEIGGVAFGAIGAIVGVATDFSRSTVYKAP